MDSSSCPAHGHQPALLQAQAEEVARGADEAADDADEPAKRRHHGLLAHALLHEERAVWPGVVARAVCARVIVRVVSVARVPVCLCWVAVARVRRPTLSGRATQGRPRDLHLHAAGDPVGAHDVHEHA
eukprot:CAMPEP_0206040566 /NCGR_PEP_ID=MMETSP1466-20131121/5452_1 /ASSEMBLY_ACC=CAM_ASM_001126 /TAXON_ID=44452 /ORGANISM="Pavlova gyrans, Strain CCMP608" /LENGTH=127 /DNA_ID=CAMNT_0053415247 /DNA_START=294 /DNA_END=677 /DNA_ORIENTATION=+